MIKMIALILGGGAGSRLYPLTWLRSKPAVPIGGKYRLIDIPISNCINSGAKRIFVLTQFNSASLNQHIKNTYHFDIFSPGFVDILAAEQTPQSDQWYQGTADAVRQSMHHLINNHDFDYVLILSGDHLYQMNFEDFAQFHVDKNADITIATIPCTAADAPGFGIMKVNVESYISSFIEKPKPDVLHEWHSEMSAADLARGKHFLASMGIYIFNRQALINIFDAIPTAKDFGKEIIPGAIHSGLKVASFQFNGYWTDIGTIKSFYEANIALTDDVPAYNMFDSKQRVFTRPRILAPSKVFGTRLHRSLMAEGCICHADTIEQSIIGIRSRIGPGTKIYSSIIMGADYYESIPQLQLQDNIPIGIGQNCLVSRAILDKNCRIGNNVRIVGHESLPDAETETYCTRDGIVVVKKNAVIPDDSRIGMHA